MDNVLTLIAAPGGLDDATVARARAGLDGIADAVGDVDWLAPGTACDLEFTGAAPVVAAEAARAALAGAPVDVMAQARAGRRKALLVADMDSTIVTAESLDELADEAGIKERIAAITARAMNGEVPFRAAVKERVGLLAGLPAAALERTMARLVVAPGARTLVATMGAGGAATALVSGGFDYFTRRVAAELGFDHDLGNRLEIVDGALTGRVLEPMVGKQAKRDTLDALAAERGLFPAQAVAVGDGANDLPMLAAAGLGIAFRAKPVVAAATAHRLDHADLTGVLYAQGYRGDEFVA
jgi:phosphoserine phosphatase